jgi:hypothetical protein
LQSGLGNLHENAIPLCQAVRIQTLVNNLFPDAAHLVPFWLDTLCVPLRRPARDKAITAMRATYTNAAKVLVLDAVLSQVSISEIDLTEIAMRIRTSTWGRRLWTFHEVCLARDLYYQFADRAITCTWLSERQVEDCLGLPERYRRPKETTQLPEFILRLRLTSINRILDRAIDWVRSQQTGFDFDHNSSVVNLTNCLRYRWTSRLSDETICLAGILGHDLGKVLEFETEEDRMKAFLLSFDELPADILFLNRPRVEQEGYRWMPCSFLGGGYETVALSLQRSAIPTASGLKLSPKGMLFEVSDHSRMERRARIEYKGHFYRFRPQDPEHTFTFSSSRMAIILRLPLFSGFVPPPGVVYGKAPGVLVAVKETRDGVLVVRFEVTIDIEEEYMSPTGGITSLPTVPCSEEQKWLVV